jgi:hypothetical protein
MSSALDDYESGIEKVFVRSRAPLAPLLDFNETHLILLKSLEMTDLLHESLNFKKLKSFMSRRAQLREMKEMLAFDTAVGMGLRDEVKRKRLQDRDRDRDFNIAGNGNGKNGEDRVSPNGKNKKPRLSLGLGLDDGNDPNPTPSPAALAAGMLEQRASTRQASLAAAVQEFSALLASAREKLKKMESSLVAQGQRDRNRQLQQLQHNPNDSCASVVDSSSMRWDDAEASLITSECFQHQLLMRLVRNMESVL